MKKSSRILLIIAIFIVLLPQTAFASSFTDMPEDWSTVALKNAISNGLIEGENGKVMPKANLTRAQMATIINRAFGAVDKASLAGYADVPTSAWYYDEMSKAVKMKTFVGSGDRLNPDANITREEVFVVLAKAFKLTGAPKTVLDGFLDKSTVKSWAIDATASLISAGYISGSNNRINPQKYITRAEFAQLMDNLIKKYITTAGTFSSDINGNVMINMSDVILKDMTVAGDLIIGDGVGNGNVTLNNVTVKGRTLVRGGGIDSIKIIGDSSIQNIIVARVDGQVRIYAEDGTQIGEIIIDGSDDVIIEGDVASITILASDITVSLVNADVFSITTEGKDTIYVLTQNR
jgi:hypothetical protein